ncbi:hypothetical protein HG15A2_47810 [Adhaeretor mobilis]|uniref:Uncharacterized protein n=1 Tax=Adhaeretor mobilis TaxID=1930276 RepID=A0A517N2S8_9BACT|nr:hypothetical protein HG15A2_47810 [Adhaeretor mobilis]
MGANTRPGTSVRRHLSDKTLLYTPVRNVRSKPGNSCRNSKQALRYGSENELDSNNEYVGLVEFVVGRVTPGTVSPHRVPVPLGW